MKFSAWMMLFFKCFVSGVASYLIFAWIMIVDWGDKVGHGRGLGLHDLTLTHGSETIAKKSTDK